MTFATNESEGHFPSFQRVICGDMTDRERMGLPARYVERRFERRRLEVVERLRRTSRDVLLAIIGDARATLLDRIVAGDVLALVGDPRIVTEMPEMLDVPAATVGIGLPFDDVDDIVLRFGALGLDRRWIEKETPRHDVFVAAFRIARFPVTNIEYRDFLLETGHPEVPTSWQFFRYPFERSNHPVFTVSAEAASDYARWLSARTGRCFRLPSEVEWEYAAAGPSGREYPWGDTFDLNLANTAESGIFGSTAVGAFVGGESPFGVADMAGNVEEYVANRYAPYPGGPTISDHLTGFDAAYPIARGGSFARFRDLARTRRRHGYNPASALYVMGFRLVEDVR